MFRVPLLLARSGSPALATPSAGAGSGGSGGNVTRRRRAPAPMAMAGVSAASTSAIARSGSTGFLITTLDSTTRSPIIHAAGLRGAVATPAVSVPHLTSWHTRSHGSSSGDRSSSNGGHSRSNSDGFNGEHGDRRGRWQDTSFEYPRADADPVSGEHLAPAAAASIAVGFLSAHLVKDAYDWYRAKAGSTFDELPANNSGLSGGFSGETPVVATVSQLPTQTSLEPSSPVQPQLPKPWVSTRHPSLQSEATTSPSFAHSPFPSRIPPTQSGCVPLSPRFIAKYSARISSIDLTEDSCGSLSSDLKVFSIPTATDGLQREYFKDHANSTDVSSQAEDVAKEVPPSIALSGQSDNCLTSRKEIRSGRRVSFNEYVKQQKQKEQQYVQPVCTVEEAMSDFAKITARFSHVLQHLHALHQSLYATDGDVSDSAGTGDAASSPTLQSIGSLRRLLQFMRKHPTPAARTRTPRLREKYVSLLQAAADNGSLLAKYNLGVLLVSDGAMDRAMALFAEVVACGYCGSEDADGGFASPNHPDVYMQALYNLRVLMEDASTEISGKREKMNLHSSYELCKTEGENL
ncbi:hypothetical protein HDU82_000292 [Entophlyctis luteolus]|nr:hypothetical protein HDU82_000292 [Entophlyctis luteolus]